MKHNKQRAGFSLIALLFSMALLTYAGSVFYPRWEKPQTEAQLSWDASGYYWYLPSVFIYHDLKGQHFKDKILKEYAPTPTNQFQQGFRDPKSGNYVLKYTMGTAIMELPFFWVAHLSAAPLGYPADGFSRPYQVMIYLGGLCFALLGLWYFRKLLLFYYSDKVVAAVLLLLVFGTNYLNYCGIDVGLSHLWLFTLWVFILLNTHYFYATDKAKYLLRVGALIGLAALTRPPEVISAFVPLLWGLEKISVTTIKEQFHRIWQRKKLFLTAGFIAAMVMSLQFIYWKYATGSWFIYTYKNQGFSWLHPHFFVYAFNYTTGWLTFTPLLIIPIIGILPFWKSGRNKVAIIFLILLNYYIVAAWDGWQYGGRAMVQSYAILMFPLASLLHFLFRKRRLLAFSTPVILLLVYFNLWWTYQAHAGSYSGGMVSSGKFYWHTALRYNLPLSVQKMRENQDYYSGKIKDSVLLFEKDFDKTGKTIALSGNKRQSTEINLPLPPENISRIRAYADVSIQLKEWGVWEMSQIVIQFKKDGKVIKQNMIRLQRVLVHDGENKTISIDAKIPEQPFDQLVIFFLNPNQKHLFVHRLRVIGFNAN